MSNLFTEAFSALSGVEFEEVPVDVDTFVTSDDYLGLPPLSDIQKQIVKAGSQILRKETLVALYGDDEGLNRWKQTFNEVWLLCGKGSGKDFVSTIICAYIAYILLCMKDPASYYGKPRGDSIAIMNVARNAQQANRVFFKGLANIIENSPWFDGKAKVKGGEIEFIKGVVVVSGHSESESLEGYNVIAVILDELDSFQIESATGNANAITAQSTYDMHSASVSSRFPDSGKLIVLSFPRSGDGFVMNKYREMVVEKDTVHKEHTFKADPDLPDGIEENELTVEWEEDHIVRYKYPRLYALKRPTWDVNPLRTIDDFSRNFFINKTDSLGRFAAMPSEFADDIFFKDRQAIEDAFTEKNGVDEDGVFAYDFEPDPDADYYIHVDLSAVHDRCAVAIGHVDKWSVLDTNAGRGLSRMGADHYQPHVKIDALYWWQPSPEEPMDYKDVEEFILKFIERSFNVKLVTFDRYNSQDLMRKLKNYGIETELLGLKNTHYDDFLTIMYSNRLKGPRVQELKDELRELRYIKGKVDHPRGGHNDLATAVCGTIYNCVSRSTRKSSTAVEVRTLSDIHKEDSARQKLQHDYQGVISAPKKSNRDAMPEDIRHYMDNIRML